MPSLTAEVLGSGAVGAVLGWGLSLISSGRSFRQARRQAERAAKAQLEDARKAALLALAWELEVNQELLERQGKGASPVTLLRQVALDAGLRWYRGLPDTARGMVHEAQLAMARFNAAAECIYSAGRAKTATTITKEVAQIKDLGL